MGLKLHRCIVLALTITILLSHVSSEFEEDTQPKLRSAPHKRVGIHVIDGAGKESNLHIENTERGMDDKKIWRI
ncbi:unnamed protein product [Rhodiola kirilowii]